MPEYVRVTDLDTGHKLSVQRSQLGHGKFRELQADALDENGDPLPPEHNAVKPLSNNNEGPSAATDTKEK